MAASLDKSSNRQVELDHAHRQGELETERTGPMGPMAMGGAQFFLLPSSLLAFLYVQVRNVLLTFIKILGESVHDPARRSGIEE